MTPDAIALGVDFGTSNTVAVLRWPDGRVRSLLFDGSPALLSGVFAAGSGELLAGRDAAHAARSQPECFEPNPKRHIDEGTLLLGAAEVPVVEVVAAVLRRVATEAHRAAGGPVADVVLTHPAAWGTHRRQVLRDAAVKAGLAEPELVPEPVAAASYFVCALDAPVPVGRCLVVYDFGAGTFDASVVRRTAGGFDVLASEGLSDAGGLDVDAAILAHLGAVYASRDPAAWRQIEEPDSVGGRKARRLLWEDIRTAKEMLSRSSATLIPIPLLDEDAPLGREQLELLARPILDRTVAATRAAVRAAGVPESHVAGLYLAGGSSRIPLAATLLHRALRIAPTAIEQPELVVAEGALYAPGSLLPVASPARGVATVSPEPAALMQPPLVTRLPGMTRLTLVTESPPVTEPAPIKEPALIVEQAAAPGGVTAPAGVTEPGGVAEAAPAVPDTGPEPATSREPPADRAARGPAASRASATVPRASGSAAVPGSAAAALPVGPGDAGDEGRAERARAAAVARRRLGVGVLVVLAALSVLALVAWPAQRPAIVTGANAALSAVLSPLALGVLVLALAAFGVPAVGARPGPARWVLRYAGWAVATLTPVALVVANRSYRYDWTDFASWYAVAVWLPFGAALLLLVLCLWLLARRVPRVPGPAVAGAAGVLCGLWWLATGYVNEQGSCGWGGSFNDLCMTGQGLSGIGGAGVPLGWLLFAEGAFFVLGGLGLAAALLRMLLADRLRPARPALTRTGLGLFVVAAVLLADLSLADRTAANTHSGLADPLARFTSWLATPSRTSYANPVAWSAALFVVLAVATATVQAVRRSRRTGRSPVSP